MKLPKPRLELVAFAASFVGYAIMAAPGVEWMDSGELSAAAFGLGGAHPPGHPAHTMLGKLASLVPLGEVAFRINLLSALGMAAAVAGVVALARALVKDAAVPAAVAAALAAASPLATSNATRAEVYAPVAALIVWAAVATVRYVRERDPRAAALAAFGCALAAAFHPVIALAAALPLAVSVGLTARRDVVALLPRVGAVAVVALGAYAYLPVRAAAEHPPLLTWGDPSTVERFFDLITAPAYRGNFGFDGYGGRFAGLWMLVGEGAGLGLLFAGFAGLAFAALTGLRGAGTVLAAAACVVAGAATQSYVNPDMPGYTLPALLLLAAGVAPLVGAVIRTLPDTMRDHRAVPIAALVPVALLSGLGPIARADDGGMRRTDDALRYWDETIGAVPPGPAIYFANADHALFPAQYERLVAGARPDVVIANHELARDVWFLEHLDAMLPELYVPYVDDLATDAPAARLASINMRAGVYVGGDVPAFGPLLSSHAAPRGRGWRYALTEIDTPQRQSIPPLPPRYEGGTGHRVAGYVALTRAVWEAERGRLDRAARAAGLEARFGDDGVAALRKPTARPNLYGLLPSHTPILLYADWQAATLGDDLAWRAGLATRPPPDGAPFERRLLADWHALLEGDDTARARIAELGRPAALATARMLFDAGKLDLADRWLTDMIDANPNDLDATILLGSLRGNRADFAAAERLFRRAIEIDPSHADAHARLGVALANQDRFDEARAAWQRALELDPNRRDVRAWLDKTAP